MMVKEYFIKNFGVPVHTIGSGGSGGSMQQHLIAQNYPGLLDGITPAASYPDITTLVAPVADCTLLTRAFESSSQTWTEEQRTAVSGFATWRTCGSWISTRYSPGWIQAGYCDASVPKASIYDPVNNPQGVRCTLQDNQANVYGREEGGFAPRLSIARACSTGSPRSMPERSTPRSLSSSMSGWADSTGMAMWLRNVPWPIPRLCGSPIVPAG